MKHVNSNYTYNERKKHPIIDKTDELDAECIAKVTLDELDNLPDAKDDEIYWTLKQLIKMTMMKILIKITLQCQLKKKMPSVFFQLVLKQIKAIWRDYGLSF